MHQLEQHTDPAKVQQIYGALCSDDYTLNLQNSDASGNVVAQYEVPASTIRQLMQHVGFNNIPFDQSVGVLSIFLNMFYPTDNPYSGDQLGYYRQREWRIIGGDIFINGRPMGRELTNDERQKLTSIDPGFWERELTIKIDAHTTIKKTRAELALVYEPIEGWDFFDLVGAIYLPRSGVERARSIVGEKVQIVPTD